jgi:hypothetical protein
MIRLLMIRQVPVQQREVLRPAQVPQVGPEFGGALDQVGQVRVGELDPGPLAPGQGHLDVPGGQLVANAARSGVQEQPDPVLLV